MAVEAAVFFGVPALNVVYDGWPRGWLLLTAAVICALCGGLTAGLAAVASAAGLIWWRGVYFTPMHPGLEVFAAIGVFHVLVIDRLQVASRTVAREREAFVKMFRHNAAGLVLTRLHDGKVLDVNDAYLRMAGYDREGLIGLPVGALWKSYAARDQLVAHLLQHGGVQNFEATVVRKEGEELEVLVSAQVVELWGQATIVSSVQDITALKRAESAWRHANEAKDRFLASLSHELRTPLNVVLGYARVLRQTTPELPPNKVKMLEAMERNATAQLRIVEDLLDMQRISTGKFTLSKSTVDLQKLEQAVVDTLQPSARAKGIHYFVEFDRIVTSADGPRLQQVLWNLLSNAIKFTPSNGCVGVYGKRQNDRIIIKVVDSGEGIPRDFLPHVFDRFRQLDESTTRRHSGLGLGLAISREIIELHGGTIDAHSDGVGSGATFTVVLPLVAPDDGGVGTSR